MIVLLIACCLLFVLYALWLLRIIRYWYAPNAAAEETNQSEHLAIVIPFRNEAEQLPKLLSVLADELKTAPGVSIYLVNDHSTDSSAEIAHTFAENTTKTTLIHQSDTHGKKQGVDLAVGQMEADWIVTLDADVQPCKGWLKSITAWTSNNTNDLLILPLHIGPGHDVLGRMQEVEFASVLGITAGMAMDGKPILCNGANLCFRREAYVRVRAGRSDMHITSGDDVFLLNALKANGRVHWVHDPNTRVSTAPQTSVKQFIAQRLRWMGKAGFVKDAWLQATAWLTFLVNLVFIVLTTLAMFGAIPMLYWAVPATLKIVLDGWLVLRVGNWMCIKQLKRFYLMLIFVYPFYATLLPLISQFVKPTWKGRKTINH